MNVADLRNVLDEVMHSKGWTMEEAVQALEWLARPTVRPIVGVREFMESKHYMGTKSDDGTSIIYPKVMDELIEMNNGEYDQVVLTGSIGSAKTTASLYSLAYQLYVLSCYENPHGLYGLDPSSEIVFIFQSLNATTAKEVNYERFRAMVEKSPYFQKHFPFDPELSSELKFPKRIYVRPVSAKDTAAIGQNVFGGMLDEVNFMQIVENSKVSVDRGVYDQAKAMYDSISKRRKSRFGDSGGRLPGLLCLSSSARYPGQFTDRLIAESKEDIAKDGKTRTYVYNKRTWDIRPEKFEHEPWFKLFIGDAARKPRILKPGEEQSFNEADQDLIDTIPEAYRKDFERDIMGALRDVAGHATLALHPFMPDREAVQACKRKDHIIFSREWVDFVDHKLSIKKSEIYKPEIERFVHCDLAISGDSAGFVVGCVTGFKTMPRGQGEYEIMPEFWIDGALEIRPPRGGEIMLYKVREVIYALKRLGLNIKWVTFDQYQSRDSMQLLKQQGYTVGYQSMDINTMPYDFVKNAFYDRRVNMPGHERMETELASLEKDVKKGKIDHPAGGSKDVSDALAGVIFGLTMRREVWGKYGVSLGQIPKSIIDAIQKKNEAKQVGG